MTAIIILSIISTFLFVFAFSATYTAAYYKRKALQYLSHIDALINQIRTLTKESLSLADKVDECMMKLEQNRKEKEDGTQDNA